MGNYNNAYITKQPKSVDPSEWIDRQEDFNNYQAELQRQRDAEAEAKKRKQFDGDFSGEYDLSSSGNGTIDSMLMQIGMQSLGELKEAKEAGERALQTKGPTSEEYLKAKQRYDNIMSRPDMLKLATSSINTSLNERNKLMQSGDYLQDPSDIKSLESFTKNPIKWKNMPDGTMLINSGEVTSSLKDFAGSLELNPLIPKIDQNAIIQDIATKFKDKIIEDRKGYTTTKKTNTWGNTRTPDGQLVEGAKTMLTRQYEDLVDDAFAKSVLASKGQFGYDSMSDETKEQLRAKIINDMVENSRPYIKEAIEEDFDTSARNQDARIANDKQKEDTTNGISFVEEVQYGNDKSATANLYAFNTPYVLKGTGKSERPKTLYQIRFDEQNGNVVLIGKEYVGKETVRAVEDLENNGISLNETGDTKFTTTTNEDDWRDVTVSNRTQVTSILSKVLGAESYEEIQKKLRRQEQDTPKTTKSDKPIFD